jgi:hypothetical protein
MDLEGFSNMQELLTLVLILVILYDVLDRRRNGSILSSQVPIKLEVSFTPVAEETGEGETQEPLPRELVEYIDLESDEWARMARRQMARKYYAKEGNWEAVLHQLKVEDKVP